MVRMDRGRYVRTAMTAGSAALAMGVWVLSGCVAAMEQSAGSNAGEDETTAPTPVVADLEVTVEALEEKLLALAEAMDEDLYDWRPMEGVRSVGEVFMHVAADNYFMPILAGVAAPAATGITLDYEATVVPFESRALPRAETIAVLRESFVHLRSAMAASPPMEEERDVFGNQATVQGVWVQTVTHLHEHLGQSIAYARTNRVVPPWSRPTG